MSSGVRTLIPVSVGVVYRSNFEVFSSWTFVIDVQKMIPAHSQYLQLRTEEISFWRSGDAAKRYRKFFDVQRTPHMFSRLDSSAEQLSNVFQSSHCFLCRFQNFDDVEASENEIWKIQKPSETVLRVRIDQEHSLEHTWRFELEENMSSNNDGGIVSVPRAAALKLCLCGHRGLSDYSGKKLIFSAKRNSPVSIVLIQKGT